MNVILITLESKVKVVTGDQPLKSIILGLFVSNLNLSIVEDTISKKRTKLIILNYETTQDTNI